MLSFTFLLLGRVVASSWPTLQEVKCDHDNPTPPQPEFLGRKLVVQLQNAKADHELVTMLITTLLICILHLQVDKRLAKTLYMKVDNSFSPGSRTLTPTYDLK